MPRTKRPARKSAQSAEKDEVLNKLQKIAEEQKKKLDSRAQMESRNIEIAFKILLGTISDVDLKKTVGQLKTELNLKGVTITGQTARYSQAASQDDGYNTENSSHGTELGAKSVKGKKFATPASRPPTASSGRSTARRSRSADAAATGRRNAPPRTVQAQRCRSRSVYRTPAYNSTSALNYPAITPKVAPHTPLTVLRQPRQGEMVVSMSGSPVMVPTCYSMNPEEKASCNILLQDGTMLSLQPKQLRQSQAYIPFSLMDSDVLHQLKTLKNNLDTMVKLGEKVMM